MCGQVGFVFGTHRDRGGWTAHLHHLRQLFTNLLVANEARGKDATGLGWMGPDGDTHILKTTQLASEWVSTLDFASFMRLFNRDSAALVGHTRWPSNKTAPILDCDNQPLQVGSIWGTHNGTVYNADELFQQWGLPRNATVDSEILFQLAYQHLRDGRFQVADYLRALAPIRGQYSGIMLNSTQSDMAWLVRGNKPISIWLHVEWDVVLFTSLAAHAKPYRLQANGWQKIEVPVMTCLEFDRNDLQLYKCHAFDIHRETQASDPP